MPGVPLARGPASMVASTSASAITASTSKHRNDGRNSAAAAAKPQKYGFGTLEREKRFRNPSKDGHDVPNLEELVAPHIQSFDALFSDPVTGKGLLELAVNDITSKVIYDGKGKEQGRLGNRLECK